MMSRRQKRQIGVNKLVYSSVRTMKYVTEVLFEY